MKVFVLAAVLLPLATAHLCLVNPIQRGTIVGLDKAGSDDCFLTKKQCGDRKAQPPADTLWGGMKNNIIFQKNLDHFNSKAPGSFMVSWATTDTASSWTSLAKMPDSNTTSLTMYTVPVDIPKVDKDTQVVIQVVYSTNNPNAPADFYQCADAMIKMPPSDV